ncbi:thiopeptide-type bacteriocin biosynthesis protein [Actinomadura sp. NTSP31]|uniref:thiopeptide-type bacteriocin biosynthesis protein n=1 Tax=Actinomadura sp. NTSP31 TaxID=1735447 RepID=UPI0035BF48B6
MPPDQLNRLQDDQQTDNPTRQAATQQELNRAEDAVLHVLAGTPLKHVADCFRMSPATLATAVETYQRAGRQALHHQSHSDWCQLYIEFPDWPHAEKTAADHLAPLLDATSTAAWWFIRKHPCWRVRLRRGSPHRRTTLTSALDELAARGIIQSWWHGVYEPETTAFGGSEAMAVAHELFCADSHAILNMLPTGQERLGRRELSILLCTVLFRAAGLEWYEQGDAWHHVAKERPLPADVPAARLQAMAESLRLLMSADLYQDDPLLSEIGPLPFTVEWTDAFRRAGQILGTSARAGTLERGLRRVLAYHVIFHWNRLGFPLRTQSILATAAHTAILTV